MTAESTSVVFSPDSILRSLGRTHPRVLLVGPGAAQLAGGWAACGAAVQALENTNELPSAPGPWDVIVLEGALDVERWDRWLVQRIHRLMAPGGTLLVSAANLLDVWSLTGLRYLASRVLRQLRRRLLPRGAIPTADRSAFRGRRYLTRPLLAMIEDVGFVILDHGMNGHGLPGPLQRALGRLGKRTSQRVMLSARRLPSLWGEGRPFPAPKAALELFRARHAVPLAAREHWRARFGSAGAVDLDVDDWARRVVGAILSGRSYREGRTAVFVLWDEYHPVPNLVVAPSATPGPRSTPASHAALLRTVDEMLGLPILDVLRAHPVDSLAIRG